MTHKLAAKIRAYLCALISLLVYAQVRVRERVRVYTKKQNLASKKAAEKGSIIMETILEIIELGGNVTKHEVRSMQEALEVILERNLYIHKTRVLDGKIRIKCEPMEDLLPARPTLLNPDLRYKFTLTSAARIKDKFVCSCPGCSNLLEVKNIFDGYSCPFCDMEFAIRKLHKKTRSTHDILVDNGIVRE